MGMEWMTNVYLWIGMTFLFLLLFLLLMIFLIILGKKTHAIDEFRAWMGGKPIAMFFEENRYCEWKPVSPEGGIIIDKHYGGYIINEKGTYVDKKTKNILIPLDSNFGASINVHAAKLADDLQYIVKDDEQMKMLRHAVATNQIKDTDKLNVLKTSIHFGAIKNMMTALIPHNITAKIEKMVAERTKQYGKVNVPEVAILFAAVLGAILIGYLIIRLVAPAA